MQTKADETFANLRIFTRRVAWVSAFEFVIHLAYENSLWEQIYTQTRFKSCRKWAAIKMRL